MDESLERSLLLGADEKAFLESFLAGVGDERGDAEPSDAPGEIPHTHVIAHARRSASPEGPTVLYDDDVRGLGLDKLISNALLKSGVGSAGALMRAEDGAFPSLPVGSICDARAIVFRRARAMGAIGYDESPLAQYLGILSPLTRMTFDPLGFGRPLRLVKWNAWCQQSEAVHLVSRWVSRNASRLGGLYDTASVHVGPTGIRSFVSPQLADRLRDAGIVTVDELARASQNDLVKIKGVAKLRAESLVRRANAVLRGNGPSPAFTCRGLDDDAFLQALLALFGEDATNLAFASYERTTLFGNHVAEVPFMLWTLPMADELLVGESLAEAERSLERALDWFQFDGIDNGTYDRTSSRSPEFSGPLDLEEWVCGDYLAPRDRACLSRRLNGEILRSIGDRFGITAETVRQIVKRAIRGRPPIKQDAYLPLFVDQGFSSEAFLRATSESERTLAYLKMVKDVAGPGGRRRRAPDKDMLKRIKAYEQLLSARGG